MMHGAYNVEQFTKLKHLTHDINVKFNAQLRHFIRHNSPGVNVFQMKSESVRSLIILPIGHDECLHVKYDVFGLHSYIQLSSELRNSLM